MITKLRLAPEWAPQKAILIAWPFPNGDWSDNYGAVERCYCDMLKEFTQRIETWVLLHPSLSLDEFKKIVIDEGITFDRLRIFNDIDYDDTWVRDYGPLSCRGLDTFGTTICPATWVTLQFNGWGGKFAAAKDNLVARALAYRVDEPIIEVDFVGEGGALEINSHGVMLANKSCVYDLQRNAHLTQTDIETLLKNVLGITDFCWLDDISLTGDDTDGHIDTLARFIDDSRVVYSGRNNRHVDSTRLEMLHKQISAHAKSRGWALYELPCPEYRSIVDGRLLPLTYANFLISNNTVFTPVYGLKQDQEALRGLREVLPDKEIVPINCTALLEQHGSLHCATMQVAC